MGIYGITQDEVENYPGLDLYIVNEGPEFPDMTPVGGGYGGDEEPKEVIYNNGTDDSLKWYYALNVIAAIFMIVALLSIWLTVRTCRSGDDDKSDVFDDKSDVADDNNFDKGEDIEQTHPQVY